MTEEQLQAIESRLLGEHNPIDVGDRVVIEDFMFNRRASGTVTKRNGGAIWLDDKPTQYWDVDAHRDEPTKKDDIRALLAEMRSLRAALERLVSAIDPLRDAIDYRNVWHATADPGGAQGLIDALDAALADTHKALDDTEVKP